MTTIERQILLIVDACYRARIGSWTSTNRSGIGPVLMRETAIKLVDEGYLAIDGDYVIRTTKEY